MMKRSLMMVVVLIAIVVGIVFSTSVQAASVQSISRIAFGPENTLFVADWKAARMHALTLPVGARTNATPFNLRNLDATLAKVLGSSSVEIEDMAARPGTNEVYVALSQGEKKDPAIVVVTADGAAQKLNWNRATSVAIEHAPGNENRFWQDIPGRSFTVTDMKWRDGKLFVAGLSNQDFASTLRLIPYPFSSKATMSSIEIYHASHNQIETRAPIRTMTFADLDGKPYLVAAYTCTPLVTIPLADLKDGAHLRGKTIAELGYGNTPGKMISYSVTDQGKTTDYILLTNLNRSADLLPIASLQAANAKPGLSTPVPFGQITGVQPIEAPFAGVFRIDNLNDQFFIALRRNLTSGVSELVSISKQFNFRVSDFVSEYNFPAYNYGPNGQFQRQYIKPVQDTLMRQEGYSNLIQK